MSRGSGRVCFSRHLECIGRTSRDREGIRMKAWRLYSPWASWEGKMKIRKVRNGALVAACTIMLSP